MDFDAARDAVSRIISELRGVLVGKELLIRHVVATLAAGGHVLVEGPPGVAKTLLAKTLAKAVGGDFRRVQGNPDLLPTDLTGYYVRGLDGSTRFVKGPVFTNILMVDELNRIPSRAQSALLQAMSEYQVSIDGITHELLRPFHVIATEVPTEEEFGVYPLTLTLRDRFWIKCSSGYSSADEEFEIVKRSDKLYLLDVSEVSTVVDLGGFRELQRSIDKVVYVDDRVIKYIVDLVNYLRNHQLVRFGPSSRGATFLYRVSKVLALLEGRDYVIPDDVKELAVDTLAHRVVLRRGAEVEGVTPQDLVNDALSKVPVPKE